MSFTVRVFAEDSTNNGYILKPLVQRMLSECGKPRARVEVLSLPEKGYEHIKATMEEKYLNEYLHIDLLLFMPDADGKDRTGEFLRLERIAGEKGARLICCAAKEEVESWLLSGHVNDLNAFWGVVRSDLSAKENHFEEFLAQHGNPFAAGGGRQQLMRETLRQYRGLLQRCPELAELEKRIKAVLADL